MKDVIALVLLMVGFAVAIVCPTLILQTCDMVGSVIHQRNQ